MPGETEIRSMNTSPKTLEKAPNNDLKGALNLNKRQMGYILLRKQGVSIADSAKATGYNLHYAYQLEKKLKGYDLTDEYWLSEASKVLKNILKGKPWGKIEEIKGSTALEAVRMIFDRHQPVVRRQENFNISADLGFVDLSEYRIRYPEETPKTEDTLNPPPNP